MASLSPCQLLLWLRPSQGTRRGGRLATCFACDPTRGDTLRYIGPRHVNAPRDRSQPNLLVSYRTLAHFDCSCVSNAAINDRGASLACACIVHNRYLRRASLRPRAYKLRAHRPATTARRRCGSRDTSAAAAFPLQPWAHSPPQLDAAPLPRPPTTTARAPADDTPIAR